MRRHRSKLYLLFILILLVPQNASTCGPFFPDAIFTYQTLPGKPLKAYAQGNLGVVLPGFARSYLVVAYRYLAGRPLSAGESRGALDYWRRRLQGSYDEDRSQQPEHEWLEARNAIAPRDLPAISKFQQIDTWDYQQFINCQDDAFHTAAFTLKDRAKRFGARSEEIREWIQGQDAVFSNCAGNGQTPAMIPEGRPAVFKADRRYQIAAAKFYQRDFNAAQRQFDEIARDQSSPWRTIAPYLAARCVWREAVLGHGENRPEMEEAYQRLRKILNDPSQKRIHRAARALMGYISYRLYPEQRTRELAKLLSGPRPDPDFYQDLIDFTLSMDRAVGGPEPYSLESGKASQDRQKQIDQWLQKQYQRLAPARAESEMTDWMVTFHQIGRAGTLHAISMWRKHQSELWLVAALDRIDPGDREASELLIAARQVPPTSPSYATVAYHQIRLFIGKGELDKARSIVNAVLGNDGLKLSFSSRNLFLAQREQLATSFEDFIDFAPRPLVDVEYGIGDPDDGSMNKKEVDELLYSNKAPVELRFDRETAMVLNQRTPLELLRQASLSDKLPQNLRGELAAAAWTRAVMLGRHDVAEALLPAMEAALPSATPWLKNYSAAQGTEEKWHAALFLILQFPGLRPYVNAGAARQTKTEKIDEYRDNWWCIDVGSDVDEINYGKQYTEWEREPRNITFKEPSNAPAYPTYLTAAQVEAARNEWKELSHSGTGPNYLVREVLRWARLRPEDSRIPEALHLAVRSTRYGCDNNETTPLSQKAFALLHSRYRNSKWAKETPFWF